MSSSSTTQNPTVADEQDQGQDTLDLFEIAEIIPDTSDGDHDMSDLSDDDGQAMDEDEDEDENTPFEVINDSKAYFDGHSSSIFSISMHPTNPTIFLTGAGDDSATIWTSSPASGADAAVTPRECRLLRKLESHKDSVVATAFTPDGAYAVTGGLDGQLQLFSAASGWKRVDSAQEVDEIVWIQSHPTEPLLAVGTNEGSVWLYDIDSNAFNIRHVLYSHTSQCTAGTFTKSGSLLCTVSEDGSFYAWDLTTGQSVVALTAADQRFAIDGGLYSVAVSPSGAIAAVGGATGEIRVVGLPVSSGGGGAPGKRTGARPMASGGGSTGGGQVGLVVAALNTHTESVESLSFHPSVPLLASGSVDGRIGLYDAARGFAMRKMLDGHVEAVVKVEFVNSLLPADPWVLTSCGIDGTVRRWDARAGVEVACLKGHLGGNGAEGEGGVLGFVQNRDTIITAGDDAVALVFELKGAAAGR